MGVKGLLLYLSIQLRNHIPNQFIPSGSTLCIDGNGWMYHILSEYKVLRGREYGGMYNTFDNCIKDEVKTLKKLLGMNVIAFFDGPISRMKESKSDLRRNEQISAWANLENYCKNGEFSESQYLPLPPLYTDQLIATLKELDVDVVRCEEEADQEIARACEANNKRSDGSANRFYSYGNDNDYLLMKGCPYIKFGDLSPNVNKKSMIPKDSSRGSHLGAMGRVWQRSDISKRLGLTDEQFVELAILVGNDFTGSYPRSDFDIITPKPASDSAEAEQPPPRSPPILSMNSKDSFFEAAPIPSGYSVGDITVLHRWILTKDTNFRLTSSSNPNLQQAIEFTRDMYELRNLSDYPRRPSNNRSMSLSQEQLESVKKFVDQLPLWTAPLPSQNSHSNRDMAEGIEAHVKEGEVHVASADIGRLGIEYLEGIASESSPGQESEPDQKNRRVFEIPDEGLETLTLLRAQILERIARERGPKHAGGDDFDSLGVPVWEDVIFALQYQLVCKEIVRQIVRKQKGNSPSKEKTDVEASAEFPNRNEEFKVVAGILNPRYIYDGIIYHKLRYERRWERFNPLDGISLANTVRSSLPGEGVNRLPGLGLKSGADPVEQVSRKDGNKLPIDFYRETILAKIRSDRVIIIHGETGCGKSSRVPAMILEDAIARQAPCQMMVSQPRRIAASSLMNRLRKTLGNKVGLRMGQGIRDETSATQISFVTTGYLVRLLAHKPDSFLKYTHLIIDEVHERSVDGDLLCLLARKLLQTHPTIKLILMSATIHTELYRSYFSNQIQYYGDLKCLSVGARRFPVTVKYAEDILSNAKLFQGSVTPVRASLDSILRMTSKCGGRGADAVPDNLGKDQYNLAFNLIRQVVKRGTGVLVFVSGISDITELSERFEGLREYRIFSIHSEIPYEDQEAAFDPIDRDEIRVVIATNAAESSITLPYVDTVICLGTHKAIRYYDKTHSVRILNSWISKASATQRAGRTGRVRPGVVYRLYSKNLAKSFDEHEDAEVHRRPLQDVILRLRAMLEDTEDFKGVVPILENLIEPPDMKNVQKSFDVLFGAKMISTSDDGGALTELGRFAGSLPVAIQHSRLIAYGIALGLRYEAIVIAAALNLPRTPFLQSSPLIFADPDQYNCMASKVFLGNLLLDAGLYSQPIMMLCIYIRWKALSIDDPNNTKRHAWAQKYGLSFKAVKQFESVVQHLAARVDEAASPRDFGNNNPYSRPATAVSDSTSTKYGLKNIKYPSLTDINLLRLLLVWSSEGNVLKTKAFKFKSEEEKSTVTLPRTSLSTVHIDQLFPKVIPWVLEQAVVRVYTAKLPPFKAGEDRLQLMNDLTKVAASVSAPVVWMHFDAVREGKDRLRDLDHHHEQVDDLNGEAREMIQTKERADDRPTEQQDRSFVILGVRRKEMQKYSRVIKKLFSSQRLELSTQSDPKDPDSYDTYLCKGPTNKEIAVLDKLLVQLPICINMTVSEDSDTPAVLMAHNCALSNTQQQQLFFGGVSEHSDDSFHSSSSHERIVNEQLLPSTQKLVFPSTGEPFSLLSSSCEDAYSGEMDHTARSPLIEDFPPGKRLLNFYQLGYVRDRSVRFWRTATPAEQVQTHYHHLDKTKARQPRATGSRRSPWDRESSTSYRSVEDPGDTENDDEKMKVKLPIEELKWYCLRNRIVRDEEKGEGSPWSVMPLNSLQSVAVPLNENHKQFYAVAQSTVIIGDKGQVIRGEWITFLPPGVLWLKLALECTGDSTEKLSKDNSPANQLNDDQKLKTLEIRLILEALKNDVLSEHPSLRALVMDLFEPWVVGQSHFPDNKKSSRQVVKLKTKSNLNRATHREVVVDAQNVEKNDGSLPVVICQQDVFAENTFSEMQASSIPLAFRCPRCDRSFRKLKKLENHVKELHSLSESDFRRLKTEFISWKTQRNLMIRPHLESTVEWRKSNLTSVSKSSIEVEASMYDSEDSEALD